MARYLFYTCSAAALFFVGLLSYYFPLCIYFLILVIPFIALGLYDIQSRHNVLRNYPVIGHFRYMFEFVRPEIQQYFVQTNLSGRPYNRELRTLIYERSKNEEDTHPFGTEHDISSQFYEYAQQSLNVKKVAEEESRIVVGGSECKQPYNAARINISAMSFGALSKTAILSLNLGAKMGNFFHNTGEGGLSPYHLANGGDIVWQLGTAYFGCRDAEGNFDEKEFVEKANLDVVKMIEIKISQGAKPSHGGVLPKEKISAEIAEIRGVPRDIDCLSPPTHKEFSTPRGLLDFVQRLRKLTHGKPIGFKLCIGRRSEFMSICKAMLATGITPDFITVDGAEGGTGAAPLEYTNRLGVPINEGLAFVQNCLVGTNLRDKLRVIASGKVATGFDVTTKIALGADMCNMARPMMFAVGCIQALRCNTNTCPTGVATQNPHRARAIIPKYKWEHVKNLQANTMKSFLDITGAMGASSPNELNARMINYRITDGESKTFYEVFNYVEPGNFLTDDVHPFYKPHWDAASAERF